jgi:ribosomal protein S18 acetylase RimI-like enzyme
MVTAGLFDGHYAQLGAWTGETVEELRQQEAHHEGPRDLWLAWEDDRVVGVMQPWTPPNGRSTLYFGRCRDDAFAALAAAVQGECYARLDVADAEKLPGFVEVRRENEYEIPVVAFTAPTPPGLTIISAGDTELDKLMLLDCALREDIPGSEGWQPDPQWFREETYDSPYFDPQTYAVALDGEQYIGLARVWNGPQPLPRLGMIGVLAAYRRMGLATALLAQVFGPLAERGEKVVTAEADATNTASNTLLSGFGGRVVGGMVELHRPAER